jgi:zinc protease
MAHLLEHLVFKGTPRNPDIDKQFNQRGARWNGTTWLDRTNYYEYFQATDDNLKWAIELEADRMVNSFIRKSDLATEMTVVRNEYEMGENSPFQVLLKRLQSVAYDWHSYGRSTIGNRSDIENVKEANLQAFYRLYYQPDNAVLLVAGKFEEARALALIADAFGKIPRPTRTLPEQWTVEPTQDGEREFRIRRKGDIQIVAVAYKVPSGLHDDSDGVSFANFVLADTPTGRLHKALVEPGRAAQVFGFPLVGVKPGLHVFGAVVKKGDAVEPVRDEIIRIVEGFGAAPATAEEIARARKSFENNVEKTLANHESIGVQLSEYIALGDWRLFFKSRDDLAKVTPESVARASRAYYRRDNRTVGLYLPEDNPQRAEIPAAPAIAEVMKDFKGRADVGVSEAFEPTQANIDARTKRPQFGGVKVALLPKKNRGETVDVSIRLNMGDEKSLFGKRTVAQFAGQMLSRGTTRYTHTQLSDEMERLKISGRIGGTGGSFQTTRPNLEAALKLAAHVLKEPSFPESEFEQLRNQTVTSIQSQLAEPNARAGEALAQHFNLYPKGDWRHNPTLEESLAAAREVKLEDVKRFHRDFYGAGVAEIAVVGDFDEAKAADLIRELFAGWKAPQAFAHVSVRHAEVAPANLQVQTPDKENALFLARQNIELRDDDADHAALYIANYILGGDAALDSRLGKRLRQKEGLSYGAGSSLSVPSVDRAARWTAYAIAAPQNIARVEAAFREELALAVKDGITEAELANAKSGAMQQRLQTRAQDGAVAGGWTGYLHLGRTFAFSKAFEDRLMALTVADVNAAIRKHLDPAKVTVAKAGDFSKK